MIETNDGIY